MDAKVSRLEYPSELASSGATLAPSDPGPLICFSHLRWDFVLQRPQHLMHRFASERRVFFFEEFIPTNHHLAYLELHPFAGTEVIAVRPRIPESFDEAAREKALAKLLDDLLAVHGQGKPVLWFYTPMMFSFAAHVDAAAVVYDCMDELASFRFAPPRLRDLEKALLARADVVFTGGHSLYEAKRTMHDNIHPFPSSVDTAHFATARTDRPDPADQAQIPHPRLGFYGVIDERIDLAMLAEVAASRPDWSLVMIGPTAKIAPEDLARAPNIHYLGQKAYDELPAYCAGWDAAMMPFAINEATRFISPTKTPEYLAAGLPVVSTPVVDVRRHYGDLRGVFIAGNAADFIEAASDALALAEQKDAWLPAVDDMLAKQSWDETFGRMSDLVEDAARQAAAPPRISRPSVRRRSRAPYDVLVVGAGFAGSVLAERLAAGSGKRVLVCDRRPHIAGNAYDHLDSSGILVHRYGPHIFHTNSEDIVRYLSRFTRWRPYEHRVLGDIDGKLLPIPINRATLNGLYGLELGSDEDAARFLASKAEPVADIQTSRDVVINQVGQDLYKTFFEGYTRKQWGLDPSELDKSVTARVPTRTSLDDRYFLDSFQAMPRDGYTAMFENMLDHELIDLELGVDFADLGRDALAAHTIFTGPIDEFFQHRFGPLPYRSLHFKHETHDRRRFQPVATVNYPAESVPYTRVTEFKHLTGQVHPKTSVCYEFSRAEGDPYYPIPRPENQALYKRYEALARTRPDVTFVGRLGAYKYFNMDQVVGQSLATYRRMAARAGSESTASFKAAM